MASRHVVKGGLRRKSLKYFKFSFSSWASQKALKIFLTKLIFIIVVVSRVKEFWSLYIQVNTIMFNLTARKLSKKFQNVFILRIKVWFVEFWMFYKFKRSIQKTCHSPLLRHSIIQDWPNISQKRKLAKNGVRWLLNEQFSGKKTPPNNGRLGFLLKQLSVRHEHAQRSKLQVFFPAASIAEKKLNHLIYWTWEKRKIASENVHRKFCSLEKIPSHYRLSFHFNLNNVEATIKYD